MHFAVITMLICTALPLFNVFNLILSGVAIQSASGAYTIPARKMRNICVCVGDMSRMQTLLLTPKKL